MKDYFCRLLSSKLRSVEKSNTNWEIDINPFFCLILDNSLKNRILPLDKEIWEHSLSRIRRHWNQKRLKRLLRGQYYSEGNLYHRREEGNGVSRNRIRA